MYTVLHLALLTIYPGNLYKSINRELPHFFILPELSFVYMYHSVFILGLSSVSNYENTVMNNHICIVLHIPRNVITGSRGIYMCICNFNEYCQIVLHRSYIILHSYLQYMTVYRQIFVMKFY